MFLQFAPESVVRRLNLLFRLSMKHLRQEMKKLDLVDAGDYTFLALLFIRDGQNQDQLSRNMLVDKSYTARALARLEKMGLVERRPDPSEHRTKRVFLAQKTRDMEFAFFKVSKGWHDVLVEGIDPGDLKIILSGLDRMLENGRNSLGLQKPENLFKDR